MDLKPGLPRATLRGARAGGLVGGGLGLCLVLSVLAFGLFKIWLDTKVLIEPLDRFPFPSPLRALSAALSEGATVVAFFTLLGALFGAMLGAARGYGRR
ncbi:MAG: hypothetical protein WD278_15750 [Pirellulales bacterium]